MPVQVFILIIVCIALIQLFINTNSCNLRDLEYLLKVVQQQDTKQGKGSI